MTLVGKALAYRLVAVALTVAIAWLVTRDTTMALRIGWLDACVKTVSYYLFDRVWVGRMMPR